MITICTITKFTMWHDYTTLLTSPHQEILVWLFTKRFPFLCFTINARAIHVVSQTWSLNQITYVRFASIIKSSNFIKAIWVRKSFNINSTWNFCSVNAFNVSCYIFRASATLLQPYIPVCLFLLRSVRTALVSNIVITFFFLHLHDASYPLT